MSPIRVTVSSKTVTMLAAISHPEHVKTRTRYAVRGAAAFGLTSLLVFCLSAWYAGASGRAQTDYPLALGPLCGIIGGFAYRRTIGVPVVLATCFGLIGSM